MTAMANLNGRAAQPVLIAEINRLDKDVIDPSWTDERLEQALMYAFAAKNLEMLGRQLHIWALEAELKQEMCTVVPGSPEVAGLVAKNDKLMQLIREQLAAEQDAILAMQAMRERLQPYHDRYPHATMGELEELWKADQERIAAN
jgi:hypothetical protein